VRRAPEATARNMLEKHRVLVLEMAKDLLRHRILDGAALQIWIDRITGEALWNPDDPSGRRAAEGVKHTLDMLGVPRAAFYRPLSHMLCMCCRSGGYDLHVEGGFDALADMIKHTNEPEHPTRKTL